MKTVMALSLAALCAMACNDKKKNTEPVDTTRTTSAVVVEPTLHDGHAAEPENNNVEQNQSYDQNETNVVDQNMDMDVDQDMSGVARDAGITPSY